jgi:hypothetical protein
MLQKLFKIHCFRLGQVFCQKMGPKCLVVPSDGVNRDERNLDLGRISKSFSINYFMLGNVSPGLNEVPEIKLIGKEVLKQRTTKIVSTHFSFGETKYHVLD